MGFTSLPISNIDLQDPFLSDHTLRLLALIHNHGGSLQSRPRSSGLGFPVVHTVRGSPRPRLRLGWRVQRKWRGSWPVTGILSLLVPSSEWHCCSGAGASHRKGTKDGCFPAPASFPRLLRAGLISWHTLLGSQVWQQVLWLLQYSLRYSDNGKKDNQSVLMQNSKNFFNG